MEKDYGQFCTVARAVEVVCDQWTPLVVRELLCGSKRFNDIHRGVPRMSTSLLAQRLRRLEECGVLRRVASGKVWDYVLTEAGEELRPIIMALGHWGAKWIHTQLQEDKLDASLLMWFMRRNARVKEFPLSPFVVYFWLHDAKQGERDWWLIVEDGVADLCRDDPGGEPTLTVTGTVRALTDICSGERTPEEILQTREVKVTGAMRDTQRIWQWLGASPFAPTRRQAIEQRSLRLHASAPTSTSVQRHEPRLKLSHS